MAQFARPASDVTPWATGTFADIDETSPNDTDKVQSNLAPASHTAEYALSSVEDPQSSSGHIVRYRYQKDAAGGAQINLTVSLRQGTTTEIASWTHNDIANGWTTAAQILTGPQADAITNYGDLRLRFVATQV